MNFFQIQNNWCKSNIRHYNKSALGGSKRAGITDTTPYRPTIPIFTINKYSISNSR
jgi:hypothetical protein